MANFVAIEEEEEHRSEPEADEDNNRDWVSFYCLKFTNICLSHFLEMN